MALNAKKIPSTSSGPRAPVLDEGGYPARLVQVIDLGLQPQRPYQGQEKPPAYELQTVYESSDEFMPDEDGNPDETKPRWFWENFALHNLKSDRATSTKRYMALDPNLEHDGDWAALIGNPVIVGLTRTKGKDGNEYNNIGATSTMRAKEASKLPDLVNPPVVFDLSDPDLDVFNSLPDRIQEKIKSNLEFAGSPLEKLLNGGKGKATTGEPDTKKPAPGVQSGAEETASRSSVKDEVNIAGNEEDDDSEW